ncbi:unnamed protein product [Phytophthora fragariaefolia]|uniref:Unnamed protein product n=1 Tax=Phytophthora fragariaefolia TaxID=1490495 RepID=A0A9W6U4J1_9STRA|nr:unnamed protein product [Phytophthora fragariaefolia]
MVREHASSVAAVDDNETTEQEVELFAAADPENVSSIAETMAGETGVISLVTAHMRRMIHPVLIHFSCHVHRYNYQLLTFMAMNEFGEGAVVQQSLLEANGDWHMDRAIIHFKRSHPTRIEKLRVIIVDKDLNEIRVLEANFPDARILICHFHAIKYLKEMRSKPGFRKVAADDASQIDSAVHKMVYAVSSEEYRAAHRSLKGLCERIGVIGFFDYFQRNWHTCQDRWVLFHRSSLPHFENHTNNRLENFFGKLKDSVNGSMSMAQCVKAILAYARRKQNEYEYRVARIGQFVNSGYGEEMTAVLRFTTHFVAQHIEQQYAVALDKVTLYKYASDPGAPCLVSVRGLTAVHKLRVNDWSCNCEFASAMLLPCRHVIAYRIHAKLPGPVIPLSQLKKDIEYETFSDAVVPERVQRLTTPVERYREAVRASHLIANEMEDIEDQSEFDEMLTFVLAQWRNVRQRKIAVGKHLVKETRTKEYTDDVAVKREFGICSSEEDDSDVSDKGQAFSEDDEDDSDGSDKGQVNIGRGSPIKIRLNPKAKKVGRSAKMKKKTCAGERADRKWYASAEEGRKVAGEVSLARLLAAIDREQPGLVAAQKHTKNSKSSASTETIVVKDVGNYSRKQIEIFKSVQNLKAAIQLGLDTHRWLVDEGLPALPAEYHSKASKVAEEILGTYPKKQIKGLPLLPQFQFSLLYTVKPTTWLNDGAIRALCERLVNNIPGCRFAGFQDAVMKSKKTRGTEGNPVQDRIQERILQQVRGPGVDVVLLPLNFHNAHWCCVVIRVEAKRIFYHDPQNQASCLQSTRAIATFLKISALEAFDVIQQNNPIQFDTFSCGLTVTSSLRAVYYLLAGVLLPKQDKEVPQLQDDEGEEKMPPPQETDQYPAESGLPPTQVAPTQVAQ